ncbi:tetratricopeptide repeat protein [Actinacidiphila alni]|uniref:tetratricopeptide repeat protein n=1 Tax=Actinacidiphila alni TaxID=380248 RepID=UPI0033E6A4B1
MGAGIPGVDGLEGGEGARLFAAAESGDAEALRLVAVRLARADRTEEAESWLRLGADPGAGSAFGHTADNAEAVRLLGQLLLDTRRGAQAAPYLLRAAESGEAEAMGVWGAVLLVTGRAAEAEPWLRRAAEGGDRLGMGAYGVLLFGSPGQGERAREWLRKASASEPDDTTDSYLGPVPQPDDGAAARLGPVGLLLLFAEFAGRLGHTVAAARWTRLAAQSGDPTAMNRFGVALHGFGRGGTAALWFHAAAETGDPEGMHNLGLVLRGAGRAAEAERWLHEAAKTGHIEAMHNYGLLLQGTGREREARKWLRRAGKAHRKAQSDAEWSDLMG